MAPNKGFPIQRPPYDSEAHVITNIGQFKFCRQDKFCRCRKCKPALTKKEKNDGQ